MQKKNVPHVQPGQLQLFVPYIERECNIRDQFMQLALEVLVSGTTQQVVHEHNLKCYGRAEVMSDDVRRFGIGHRHGTGVGRNFGYRDGTGVCRDFGDVDDVGVGREFGDQRRHCVGLEDDSNVGKVERVRVRTRMCKSELAKHKLKEEDVRNTEQAMKGRRSNTMV